VCYGCEKYGGGEIFSGREIDLFFCTNSKFKTWPSQLPTPYAMYPWLFIPKGKHQPAINDLVKNHVQPVVCKERSPAVDLASALCFLFIWEAMRKESAATRLASGNAEQLLLNLIPQHFRKEANEESRWSRSIKRSPADIRSPSAATGYRRHSQAPDRRLDDWAPSHCQAAGGGGGRAAAAAAAVRPPPPQPGPH
jgi:hypothetical protein